MASNAYDSDPAPAYALAAPTLARIEKEVEQGVPLDRERRDRARKALDFYNGDFHKYPVRQPDIGPDSKRYTRHSMVMNRIVKVLTQNLYKAGPARKLPDHPAAEEWLETCYRKHLIDALWQTADRLATIADVSAFQVTGSDDPDCPVHIQTWDSGHFTVWVHPDRPTLAVAVATFDMYDEQSRIRLWTSEVMQTWLSEKMRPNQTAGGRTFRKVGKDQEHGYGILPFAFTHFELPTCEFWSGSPGDHLADVNDGVNLFLTENGDNVRFNIRPQLILKNTTPGFRPPPARPGNVWDLPSGGGDAAGNGAFEPSAEYLQSDVAFVEAGWSDLQSFLDHTLEMNGVPPTAVRMEQRGSQSGIAIVAEQIPLILWAMSRQRPFSRYEDCLAKLVLTVGANHLNNNEVSRAELFTAAADPGLVLRWPDMFPDLPGPERDQADQWLLDNGLTSRIQILMKREHLSREEAEARLEEIAEDLKSERDLLGDATPSTAPPEPPPKTDDELDDEYDDEYDDDDSKVKDKNV